MTATRLMRCKRFHKGVGKGEVRQADFVHKDATGATCRPKLIEDLFLVCNLQADRFKENFVFGAEDKQDEAALHALHILSVITKVASPSFHVQSSTGDTPRERASVQQTRVRIDGNVSSRVCNTFLTQLGYASSLSSVNMGDLEGIHEQRARYMEAFSRVRSEYTSCCTCRAASIMSHACAWHGSNPHAVASALDTPTESTSCLAAWNQREATIVRVVRGETSPPLVRRRRRGRHTHTRFGACPRILCSSCTAPRKSSANAPVESRHLRRRANGQRAPRLRVCFRWRDDGVA